MTTDPARHALRIESLGRSVEVAADQPLMAGARAAGISLPAACRNGTCRACICLLVEGRVTYRIEWPGLSADEKREGWILPCVAHAASDVVVRAPRAIDLAHGTSSHVHAIDTWQGASTVIHATAFDGM